MTEKKETRGRKATGVTPKRYFRMSDSDYEIVKKAASKLDMSISQYIRTKLLESPIKSGRSE